MCSFNNQPFWIIINNYSATEGESVAQPRNCNDDPECVADGSLCASTVFSSFILLVLGYQRREVSVSLSTHYYIPICTTEREKKKKKDKLPRTEGERAAAGRGTSRVIRYQSANCITVLNCGRKWGAIVTNKIGIFHSIAWKIDTGAAHNSISHVPVGPAGRMDGGWTGDTRDPVDDHFSTLPWQSIDSIDSDSLTKPRIWIEVLFQLKWNKRKEIIASLSSVFINPGRGTLVIAIQRKVLDVHKSESPNPLIMTKSAPTASSG